MARVLTGAAAIAMVTALWLPWFVIGDPIVPPRPDGGVLNLLTIRLPLDGWQHLSRTDVAVAVLGLSLLGACASPGSRARKLAVLVALVALVVVAVRVASVPTVTTPDPDFGTLKYEVARGSGAWVALVAAILALAGALTTAVAAGRRGAPVPHSL